VWHRLHACVFAIGFLRDHRLEAYATGSKALPDTYNKGSPKGNSFDHHLNHFETYRVSENTSGSDQPIADPQDIDIENNSVVENSEDISAVAENESQTFDHPVSGAAARREQPHLSLELALAAAKTAAENGATEIVVLDMTEHTAIFDYFVIATGTSRRQLHAISEDIDDKLEKELNDKRMNIDGFDESRWIVLDYGTVVIHLFDEDTRQFYSLEALWADAKKIDLTETLKNVRR